MRAAINTNSESTMSETQSIAAQLMAGMSSSRISQAHVSQQRRGRAHGCEAGKAILFRVGGYPEQTPRASI